MSTIQNKMKVLDEKIKRCNKFLNDIYPIRKKMDEQIEEIRLKISQCDLDNIWNREELLKLKKMLPKKSRPKKGSDESIHLSDLSSDEEDGRKRKRRKSKRKKSKRKSKRKY